MGQVLHGCATTTEAIRRAIQQSEVSLRALAKRYGINQKTVAKWKRRTSAADIPTGPKDARSTVPSIEEEAIAVAFRRHTLLPLDDCLYAFAGLDPVSHAIIAAPLSAAPRDQPPAGRRWRQAREAEIQDVSDRLFPHRHRRGSDRAGQAPPVCRDRSNLEIRLRRTARESHDTGLSRRPRPPPGSRALQGSYGSDRQRHPVHDPGSGRIGRAAHPRGHGER